MNANANRWMKSLLFSTAVLSCSVLQAAASPRIAMSLPTAIAYALHKNADVKSAYLQRVLDKFNLQLAKENYRIQPTFNIDTITTALPKPFTRDTDKHFGVTPGLEWDTPYSTKFNFAWSNTWDDGNYGNSESLTITQPLLQGFGKQIAEAPLDDALEAEITAKMNLRQTLTNTITTVIADYYALQQSEMSMTNAKRTLLANERHFKEDRLRIKAGDLAPSELSQDEFQVEQQKMQIGQTKNSLNSAHLKLADDLGLDSRIGFILSKDIAIPNANPNKKLSEEIILAQNITYQEALLGLKSAKRGLLIARDNSRWNLSLAATAARSSTDFAGGDDDDPNIDYKPSSGTVVSNSQVSLTLTVPLGKQRIQNEQAIAQAKIALQNDIIKLKQQKQSLINQADEQVDRIKEDLVNVKLSERSLVLQQKTLNVTRQKVKYGMATNFELFSQQSTYDEAEQSVINNKISYLNDLAQFDSTLGTTLETWHVKVKY